MEVPCVRAPREEGEATRQRLADADLIDDEYELTVDDGSLYIPITDPDAIPAEFEVVSRTLEERDTQTSPTDLLGFEPTYERLGRAALLDEDDDERAREIADAIVASDLPLETVLNKASKVKGETRVRDWELLAGANTEVVHREYGCEFLLDLAEVYFSPRLATERNRVVEQVGSEARSASENASGQRQRAADEHVFDMFAGVGPFVIPIAKRGAECVGVDVNPDAIDYLRENARRNGVEDRVTAICDDVRNLVAGSSRERCECDGVREVAPEYEGWADRVVMNLPHSADEFLEAAVTVAGDDCVLHYYDIQHEDDPFGPGERAIREAAEPAYDVSVETERVVRSYAPHELNVCLDVRLER
ncbi:class I SAM-dependent methyltransferase family protein [Haloterrigena salifodinae]|uniref:Class I SAM-dependent methyltransferase family protein n=1 Tax=Haloterrigena salifodinae TaxID=2675099 RepID=A0A8T8DYD8_9EURY|nr:class I SAM-dependent methyltransferase family protein [Haloterrigena salifodinae]QRV14190.1 class I SAM-dependent methyltransferase family protein [Haloterrigena salifodinae]